MGDGLTSCAVAAIRSSPGNPKVETRRPRPADIEQIARDRLLAFRMRKSNRASTPQANS